MYLHVGAEFSVFHCKTSGAAGLHKFFVQGNRLLRFGRVGKAGTAFLQVSIEGELGNHQKRTAHLVQAQVHLSVFIFKNAAVTDFFRHLIRYGFRIFRTDAQQNQKTLFNLSRNVSFNYYRRFFYSGYYGSHRITPALCFLFFIYVLYIISLHTSACNIFSEQSQ